MDNHTETRYKNLRYDSYGVIAYTPAYHKKNNTIWSKEDLEYLINWYDKVTVEELTFSLERPARSIMKKANELRGLGIMKQVKFGGRKRNEI